MMSKKLTKADLYDFPMAAFLQFFKRVLALLLAAGESLINAVGTDRIARLQDLVTRLEAVLLWAGVTALTDKITEGNRRLDHAFSELIAKVKGYVRFGETTAIVDAAKRVEAMLKHYGKVRNKPYDEETGTVEIILENLNGAYAADVAALSIAGLKNALQAAYDKLLALLREREAAEGTKPKDPLNKNDTFAKLKKEFAELYHEIEEIINSGATLGLSTDFDNFIDYFNPEIDRLNMAYHRARHDIKNAEPEGIPDQPYTGKAVCPVPSVSYTFPATETKKEEKLDLELGRDFNVTYKNNIEAGKATLILHGKGAFKGTNTVTFIIVGDGK